MASFDTSGLRPLDTTGLSAIDGDEDRLDTGGLRALDVSGLQSVDDRKSRSAQSDGMGRDFAALERARGDDENDAFKDESFGSLAARRGRQYAAGYVDLYASQAKSIAIRQAEQEGEFNARATERIQRANKSVANLTKILEDGVNPVTGTPFTMAERQTYEDRLSEAEQQVPNWQEEAGLGVQDSKDRQIFKRGDEVIDWGNETFGKPDERDKSIWGQVFYGLGQLTGMASLGPGAAVAGANLNSAAIYEEALQLGASEEVARDASNYALGVGVSEVIPIMRAFALLPNSIRGKVTNKVLRAGMNLAEGGLEEGGQEAFAEIANNLIASNMYDPDRGWNEGIIEAFGVGAIIGTALRGPGAVREYRRKDVEDDKDDEDQAGPLPPPPSNRGERGQTASTPPTLTPGDLASPHAKDLILEGRAEMADGEATNRADSILRRNNMPDVGGRVAVTINGQEFEGEVVDAFTTENRELGASEDGVKIRLNDGREVDEFVSVLNQAGAIRTLAEAEETTQQPLPESTLATPEANAALPENYSLAASQERSVGVKPTSQAPAIDRSFQTQGMQQQARDQEQQSAQDRRQIEQVVMRVQGMAKNSKESLRPARVAERLGVDEATATRALGIAAGRTDSGIQQTRSGSYRRRPSRTAPRNVYEVLAGYGGLKPDGDVAQSLDGNPFVPGFGKLLRKDGLSLNEAREILEDEGFIVGNDADAKDDRKVLELLDQQARSGPVYPPEFADHKSPAQQETERAEDEELYGPGGAREVTEADPVASNTQEDYESEGVLIGTPAYDSEEAARWLAEVQSLQETLNEEKGDALDWQSDPEQPRREKNNDGSEDIPFPELQSRGSAEDRAGGPAAGENRQDAFNEGEAGRDEARGPVGEDSGSSGSSEEETRGSEGQPERDELDDALDVALSELPAATEATPTETVETTLGTAEQSVIAGTERRPMTLEQIQALKPTDVVEVGAVVPPYTENSDQLRGQAPAGTRIVIDRANGRFLSGKDQRGRAAQVDTNNRQVFKISTGKGRRDPGAVEGGIFDENAQAQGDVFDAPAPAKKPRTARQAATSAAQNSEKALKEAAKGLNELFGSNKNRLGSGPSFDEETYAKALPHFKAAISALSDAGTDMAELARALIRYMSETAGMDRDGIEAMRPYLKRFMADVRDGRERIEDVPGSGEDLESDRGGAETSDGLGEADVPASAGRLNGGVTAGGNPDQLANQGSDSDGGLSQGDSDGVGGRSAGAARRAASSGSSSAAERGDAEGSRNPSGERYAPDRTTDAAVNRASKKRAAVTDRKAAQAAADKVSVTPADRDNIAKTLPLLQDVQQDDVFKAETRFDKPDGFGYLFTNGTGTGKTYTGAGIIKRFDRQKKREILVIVPSQGIADDWVEAGADLGMAFKKLGEGMDESAATKTAGKGITVTTYANLEQNRHLADRNWDLVVADESQNLMSNQSGNVTGALSNFRAITNRPEDRHHRATMQLRDLADKVEALSNAKTEKGRADFERLSAELNQKRDDLVEKLDQQPRTKVVLLSATPFAYDLNVDYAEGYLFEYQGKDDTQGGYNRATGREAFFVQHFGYRMRYNKLTKPDANVNTEVMEREFHEHLRKTGVLSGRVLDVDADYDRKFVLTPDSEGQQIDQALEWLREAGPRYRELEDAVLKRFDYLQRRYLLEAIKAKHLVPIIREHLQMGRKIVVFHDYNKGGGFNPFDIAKNDKPSDYRNAEGETESVSLATAFEEFRQANPYITKLSFSGLGSPTEQILKAFGEKAELYSGKRTPKQRRENMRRFNKDGSGLDVLMVQADAGGAGVSLHDTSGEHMRVTFNLGMPAKPVATIQQEGRTRRIGSVTDAAFRYLNTGTNWERWTFAGAIAERAGTAENLALGNQARALKQSFIDAFLDSDTYPPSKDDGKGGKEADRREDGAIDAFERAKTHYFSQQKKTRRDKAREGVDYFATPEPLAFKMVEWAQVGVGQKVLEPSAGHGAISRYFPEVAARTIIEPSSELGSKATLVSPGARGITDTFENHNLVNKYDAIVMNPPFGSGGKTAYDHLEKAVRHLRNGGRVVALLPRGPAADKRWEKLLGSEVMADMHAVLQLDLPTVTFERAGTKVATKILILEKHTSAEDAAQVQQVSRDYSNAETINELFDRIEHASIADRVPPSQPEAEIEVSDNGNVSVGGFEFNLSESTDTQGEKIYVARPRKFMGKPGFIRGAKLAEERKGGWRNVEKEFAFFTSEQRQEWLEALERGDEPQRLKPELREAQTVDKGLFTSTETFHVKRQKNVYVAAMNERVERDVYDTLLGMAKGRGGYFSSFKGNGAIPGFQFPTPDARDAFIEEATKSKESIASRDPIGYANVDLTPRVFRDGGDQSREFADKIQPELEKRLEAYGLSGKIALRFIMGMMGRKDSATGKIQSISQGRYLPAERLIQISAVTLRDKASASWVLDHEIVHVLRDIGVFRDVEWNALKKAALADKARMAEIRKRYEHLNLDEDALIEEAVADMFADWRFARLDGARGAISRAFERVVDFLRALTGAINAPSVMRAMERGEVGNRADRQQTRDRGTKDAAARHDSPYDFDSFSLDEVGAGEGAQAFGWGVYFSSSRKVAEHIRNALNDTTATSKVDLTPAEDSYLLYDKPLSEQSEKVREALKRVTVPRLFMESPREPEATFRPILRSILAGERNTKWTGDELLRFMASRLGSHKAASLALLEAGIPGVKYLDGISRNAGDGTFNYVIFDAGMIEVTSKESIARGRPPQDQQRGAVAFTNPETEERYNAAKAGVADPRTIMERATDASKELWAGFTRHYRALPNVARFSDVREQLRKLEAAPEAAQERTLRVLREITDGMSREDLDLFTRKIILDDLRWEASNDRKLPFGYKNIEEVEADLAIVDEALASRPDLTEKIRARKLIVREVARQMVEAGVLSKEQVKNPAYYRHQVLEYARAKHSYVKGNKSVKKPHWAKRMGSNLDINSNFLEAEFEWMQRALVDIETMKTITWIKESEHNQRKEAMAAAKDHNKKQINAFLARDLRENGYATGQTDPETGDPKISSPHNEVMDGFAQRIAIAFSDIKRQIDPDSVPPYLRDAARSIGNGDSHPDTFQLLAWLVDNDDATSGSAGSAFKAITERRAYTKEVLGEKYADPMNIDGLIKRGFAPEGYVAWQPEDGNLLFTAKTIPEHVIDKMLERIAQEGDAVPSTEMLAALSDAKDALVVGAKRYQMVIPEELAVTLNSLRDNDAQGLFDYLLATPLRYWKMWILMNPRRWFRYNLNNMSGDMDAMIAGNPKAIKRMGAAFSEIYRVMVKKEEPSARYREAMERGVFNSSLSVQEISQINRLGEFDRLINEPLRPTQPVRIAKTGWLKIWRALRGSTQFRENWIRFAAYLDYADRIEAGETMRKIGYGAANPEMVDAIADPKDKAALLARDLIGDYGAVSHYGQGIRNRLIPFYSWLEINTKRYTRLIGNAYGQGMGQGLARTGVIGVALGVRTTAYLTLRMAAVYAGVALWNNLFFEDEEKDLSEFDQKRLHIILGRGDDGEIYQIRFQGAFSDYLSWIGFADVVSAAAEFYRGRGSMSEILETIAKAPVKKLTSSLSPIITVPVELGTGLQIFWPDVFDPRTIRDRGNHALSLFSLENEYAAIMNRPSKGYGRSWQEAFITERDPGENAYNGIRSKAFDWISEKRGSVSRGSNITERSAALYDYKKAVRYGDDEAASAARKRMVEYGVTGKDLASSVKRAHPLGPLPLRDRARFISQLTDNERTKLRMANQWYQETF